MPSNKLKIILLGTAHPFRGGIASFNERMAQGLQNQGHEVEIWTFSLQYPNFLFPGKSQYSDDLAPSDLKIKIKLNSVNPFNWYLVGKQLKKLKPDLVISKFWLPFMGPSLGTVLKLAKSNNHTKTISVIDNIIPHEARIGDRPLANYFVKSIDGFIVMSKSVKTDMRKFTTTKPVIYKAHPIYDNYGEIISQEAAKKYLQLDSQQKYILFFGFIRDYKGLDLLLEAMAAPKIKNSNIKLIVAGEYYGNEEKYLAIIKDKGLENQLELRTKFIPNEEVKYYFCAADCVVQPYKTATQSGISQLAYHFEKPMIVTNVGGLPEIVPDGKVGYVVPISVKAITQAIYDFFNNNNLEHFEEGIKQRKEEYSWDNFLLEITELHNKL